MPNIIEGSFAPPSGRFAIVAARFNKAIVDELVSGAIDCLLRHGVEDSAIDLIWVPGSFEVPMVAHWLVETGKRAAVICLGAVIRGETTHYDHVASAATSGILNAGQYAGVPVIFGILTCDTLEQAMNRAGAKSGNKGFDAALAAIEMVNLMEKLRTK
jgi:6,7-dimethyl-8-ribityllumazine synthase